MTYTIGDQVDALARTIWGEARGEGSEGMEAVACVIVNRVDIARAYVKQHARPDPLFGDGTYASCCRAPFQFSCWNPNDPNRAKLEAVGTDDPQFREAAEIAQEAIDGSLIDITGGATHYIASSIARPPLWTRCATRTGQIGNHLFYKDVK